jgi:chromosome partitioning protein
LQQRRMTDVQTLLFATEKGGSGKTTLARSIAVAAAQDGRRPVLLDYDPQQSLRLWWDARQADSPALVADPPLATRLPRLLATLTDQDLAIIDTAPAQLAAIAALVSAATLTLVPVSPSPDDLRTVGSTAAQLTRRKAPFAFVLNRCPRGRATEEARTVLAGIGRVAPVNVGMRVAHLEAAAIGAGVTELSDRKAADEIEQLWQYTKGLLQ